MNKSNNPTPISSERYQALLESHFEQSQRIKDLEATLRAEYDFAEQKIEEIKKISYEKKLKDMFISSDEELVKRFKNFKAKQKKLKMVKEGDKNVEK